MKKENIYAREDEKFVKAVVLHANEANKLFYDAAVTEAVKSADLKNLFLKGIAVVKGDVCFKPFQCGAESVHAYDVSASAAITFTAEA